MALLALGLGLGGCARDGSTLASGSGGAPAGGGGSGGTTGTLTGTGAAGMGGATSGAGGETGSSGSACSQDGFLPQAQSYPVQIGGQTAWVHDDGFSWGYFHTFDSLSAGGVSHKVHVLLPRDYEATCARYPTVYMNDGNTAFWPGGIGDKSWDVAQAMADLKAANAVVPVLVVAVVPNDREAEYTHTEWSPGHTCCGVKAYADVLAGGVKAFVDAHYRTQPEREHTAIVGSSHGGLAAFLIAGLRPESFGMAACLSPSFWAGLDPIQGGDYGGGPLSTSQLLGMTSATLDDAMLRPRLWIDWGLVRTGGFHNEVIEAAATARGKEMVGLLQQSHGYGGGGGELHFLEDPDGQHDEISWGKRFPLVMKAFFPAGG